MSLKVSRNINYSAVSIYKLCCKDVAVQEIYVGHTTNFKSRKSRHKSTCTNELDRDHDIYLYQFIRAHGHWCNWSMIEIARLECLDKRDAETKERGYIESLGAELNKIIPTRTHEEYRDSHVEETIERGKKYYEDNREVKIEQSKEYYANNTEKVSARRKVFYENNKEKLAEVYKKYCADNREHIRIKSKEYYAANVEKIALKDKLYRENNAEKIAKYQREYKLRKKLEKAAEALEKASEALETSQMALEDL